MMVVASLIFLLLIVNKQAPSVLCDNIGKDNIGKAPEILNLVSEFTEYAMHFPEAEYGKGKCFARDMLNGTHQAFTKSIDRCPDLHYTPRFLTTSQISWRARKTDENRKSIPENRTSDAHNDTARNNGRTDNVAEEEKSKEIIHKYLAFALLLPKHPFSTDLLRSLITAGPMFPSVTIVSGNGYDFKDMCRQYTVRSFPQLFFFKDGLLTGTYDGAHNVPEVVSRLAIWTNSLPKALPTVNSKVESFKYSGQQYHFWVPEAELFSFTIFGHKIVAKVPHVTEPIMGSMEFLVPYDLPIFILSGCFVLGRSIYFFSQRRQSSQLR